MELGSDTLSIIKDPFLLDMIESVDLHMTRGWLSSDKSYRFWGKVEFKNGNTEGVQKFDAPTFDALLTQVREFINNLREQQ